MVVAMDTAMIFLSGLVTGLFGGWLIAASVFRDAALHVSVCPKCGRRHEP